MTPAELRATVAAMHAAGAWPATITEALGVEREQVERIIDRLDNLTHQPYTQDLLGPTGGHISHNPDAVALKAEMAERAIETHRTRRLNVEMGLTPKSTEHQRAGFARHISMSGVYSA